MEPVPPLDPAVDASGLSPAEAGRDAAARIVRFVESGDAAHLHGVFGTDPVILESVAPYVFDGSGAVDRWAAVLRAHVGDHVGLHGTLGPALEFSASGDRAFMSIPITWQFEIDGRVVEELGAIALVVAREAARWQVVRYAWAVVGVATVAPQA